MSVKLERHLSKLGFASRTQARVLILAKKVKVNGKTQIDPLALINPDTALIEVDGKALQKNKFKALVLNKPKGLVTTRSDEKGRLTVYSVISSDDQELMPVGRLDQATTGLLIFTNDTEFGAWLTDPRSKIPRVYIVTVRGELCPETRENLLQGVRVDGDRMSFSALELLKVSKKESHLKVTLEEGKNREIRRLMLSQGHEVTRLKRISFGDLELGDLQPGESRKLEESE